MNLGLDTSPGEEKLTGRILPGLRICASRDEMV